MIRKLSCVPLALLLTMGLVVSTSATAQYTAPNERSLRINMTVDGKQDWKNGIQWTKSTTAQRYEIRTSLRTNGKLEGANLLHLDRDTRLAIKTEFLRRQGAKKLKAAGLDPSSPSLQSDISRQMQKAMFDCKGDSTCIGTVSLKYAEIMAAAVEPENSALFEQEEPRYLFYFGYPGCKNEIHAKNVIESEGETGYGREVTEVTPFKQVMRGDSRGTESEQTSLCDLFTVVVDTLDNKMYVENVNIPSARGTAVRTEFGKTDTRDLEIPLAAPLQEWVNGLLRGPAPLSGEAETVMKLNLPLDGNATVMGSFTGTGNATLKWSFE